MRIEGSIHHPGRGEACEYCVVVSITNEQGEKIARQVVGVGALQPGERHKYSFSVDLIPARTAAPARTGAQGTTVERKRN
jgi:hypothetical protein